MPYSPKQSHAASIAPVPQSVNYSAQPSVPVDALQVPWIGYRVQSASKSAMLLSPDLRGSHLGRLRRALEGAYLPLVASSPRKWHRARGTRTNGAHQQRQDCALRSAQKRGTTSWQLVEDDLPPFRDTL